MKKPPWQENEQFYWKIEQRAQGDISQKIVCKSLP